MVASGPRRRWPWELHVTAGARGRWENMATVTTRPRDWAVTSAWPAGRSPAEDLKSGWWREVGRPWLLDAHVRCH